MIGKWNNREFSRGIAMLGLGIALVLGPLAPAWAQNTLPAFTPKVKVNEDPVSARGGPNAYPSRFSVAADSAGNAHAVWTDYRHAPHANHLSVVHYAKSSDGGRTFGESIPISFQLVVARAIQMEPAIAIDPNDNVHVVWLESRDLLLVTFGVYYAKSADGGRTFSASSRLDASGGSPAIATDSQGNIHVSWSGGAKEGTALYYAKSHDGGSTFESKVRVDSTVGAVSIQQINSSIAADSQGNVHIAWRDYRKGQNDQGELAVRYAKSADGSSFANSVRVSGGVDNIGSPYVTVNSRGNVHIVWQDAGNAISFSRSVNGGASFEPKVRVDKSGYRKDYPAIAVDPADVIHVAWQELEALANTGYTSNISHAISADGGLSFAKHVKIAEGGPAFVQLTALPAMAMDRNGGVHVTWRLQSLPNDVYYAKSSDSGETFGEAVLVNDREKAGTARQRFPSVAADGAGNIHAVWQDDRNLGGQTSLLYEVFYAKSADGGRTFGKNIKVDPEDSGNQTLPSIDVDPAGNIHAAWQDARGAYYAKSMDGGETFNKSVRASGDGERAQMPALAVDAAGNPHMLWINASTGLLYYARSADGGATFTKSMAVPGAAGVHLFSIDVGSNGNVHITWMSRTGAGNGLYYSRSTGGGGAFDAAARIDKSNMVGQMASIAAGPGNAVHIVWDDQSDSGSILHAGSEDGGSTFGQITRVDDGGATSRRTNSSMGVGARGSVYVAWMEHEGDSLEIYHAKSSDGGRTFGENVKLDGSGKSMGGKRSPAVAVGAGGDLHAVWEDYRYNLGFPDIYYSRTPLQPDVTPPAATILAPKEGAEVSGVVDISVKVQD